MSNTNQLIASLKPGTKVSVLGKNFTILQHIVWYQARAKRTYDKCVLRDESGDNTSRLFIDGEDVGVATLIHHDFKEPLPQKMEYQGKKYRMVNNEFCIVEKSEGEQIYKLGDAEIWWDYVQVDDESKGLSLGRSWETWEREDLAPVYLKPEDILVQ